MPSYIKIEGDALSRALAALPGWEVVEGKLHRAFKFKDFSEALGFMARVALDVHQLDHHPEWSNVYSRVTIDLVTHFTGGITDLDVELAGRINKIVG